MIIDCISDLHGYYPKLEGGDLLIVGGDLTATHTEQEFYEFVEWLCTQSYEKKVFIAGNHDSMIRQVDPYEKLHGFEPHTTIFEDEIYYLFDWWTEFRGLKIWGSPWTLKFKNINPKCTAFTGTENELKDKWDLIPDDVDILITHSPPWGIMDEVKDYRTGNIRNCGSKTLSEKIDSIKNTPKLWVWGHIHEEYGSYSITGIENKKSIMVNASHVNEVYDPINKPIRIEL